jgi:sortase A
VLLSRQRRRRVLRDLSAVLLIAGAVVALDALVTLVWQEPLTAVIALVRRGEIDRRYLDVNSLLRGMRRGQLVSLRTPAQELAFLARREGRLAPQGAAIGRIEFPTLGVNFDVVQGDDQASLELGPGHYPQTALPGMGRTVAIAGHRTTYLAPFRDLDQLTPGTRIVLVMPYGTFDYAVTQQQVVNPGAWWITNNVGYERLVLSACTPLYSAAQRLVVFARLTSEKLNPRAFST